MSVLFGSAASAAKAAAELPLNSTILGFRRAVLTKWAFCRFHVGFGGSG